MWYSLGGQKRKQAWYLLTMLVLVSVFLLRPLSTAHASRLQVVDRTRFVGQVSALLPEGGSPSEFTLLQPNGPVQIAINPQTKFVPGSAEANVEGLARDDYAVVNAKRVSTRWIATRIAYDVDTVLPLVRVEGVISFVSVAGRRIDVRLNTGVVKRITIGRDARFTVGGRPTDTSLTMYTGEAVGIVANRSTVPWLALEVDL